jgi:phage terminase small subunit
MPEEVKLKPLTKKQLKFVACWEGNNTDAARKAGLPFPNVTGAKMMKLPAVKAAIEEKQKEIVAASAGEMVKKSSVTRDDIISGLALLGRSAVSEQARVKAWDSLAEIFQMKVKLNRDVTQLFDGWTEEELEAYSVRGELPQRFKGSASPGPTSY